MRKILLMGNPNVGKSVIFNRLTGAGAVESNYPGTTVDFMKGTMTLDGESVELIDVPGTFSLQPKDKAEEVAVKMLEEAPGATVICVLDASKIRRGLYLTLELMERENPMVVALNMSDVARRRKVNIDTKTLEGRLGVPVVNTVATSGKGIKDLKSRIEEATVPAIGALKKKVSEVNT